MLCALIGILSEATRCYADSTPPEPTREAEPTREECLAAVEHARALAAKLPADHLSRYFAERYLLQAMVEAGNGEFDDCLEYAELATDEVKELRHVLQPGETLKVLRADE
jgi:hypothetical protein